MTGHTLSIGVRSGLQAGWSSTFTLSLRNHAVVAHAEWELALSWSNNHGLPMKDIILTAVYFSVQLQYMPPCQWYLHTYASHPCCLHWCTHIPWHAFASVADESLDGPFGLWDWELNIIFLRNRLKCGLIWVQHTFPLSSWLSKMSSGPENQAASLHGIDYSTSTLPALYPIMQCTTFHFSMMDEAIAPNIFCHLQNIKKTDEYFKMLLDILTEKKQDTTNWNKLSLFYHK